MRITITEKNLGKINEAIAAIEGKAKVRTVDYSDLVFMVNMIEKKLGIAKKYMVGIKVNADYHAQEFPSAYKYTPVSTQVRIERNTSGWVLTGVSRNQTRRSSQRFYLELPEETKKALIDKYTTFWG